MSLMVLSMSHQRFITFINACSESLVCLPQVKCLCEVWGECDKIDAVRLATMRESTFCLVQPFYYRSSRYLTEVVMAGVGYTL